MGRDDGDVVRRPGWVVVIEAELASYERPVDLGQIRRLLEKLPKLEPIALHSAERIAVQVHLDAGGEVEALSLALANLRAALAQVDLGHLRVIRAEVLTWAEFERDCRMAGEGDFTECEAPEGDGALSAGEQLLRRAFVDSLTRLPSRGFFMDQLERALVRRPGGVIEEQAVVVLNIAGMDTVNERWGRSAGDEVLASSARRLRAALAPGVTAGRIAGDEFAVLLGPRSEARAEAIAAELLEALGHPVVIGDTEVAVSASAGIAMGRAGRAASDVLAEARTAVHAAKQRPEALGLYRAGTGSVEPLRRQAAVVHDPMTYLLLVQRAAMAANESSDLEHAAGLVVSQVNAHVGFQVGHLYVVSGARLVPARLARSGSNRHDGLLDFLDRLSLGPGEALAGRVLESGRPAWVTDIASAELLPWSAEAVGLGLNAALAFPVLVGREVAAVLEFFAESAREPDDALVEVLGCVSSQLGRVVERGRALTHPAGDDRRTDD